MPTAEYARDRIAAAIRRPAAAPDFCVSLTGTLGRYWSSLLCPLTSNQGTVAVFGHLPKADYYDPHGLGRLPLQVPRVTFSPRLPRHTGDTVLLTDAVTPSVSRRTWRRVLRLRVDTETSLEEAGVHYRIPFSIFPGYAARGWEPLFTAQRTARRTTRVLFAGNTDATLYDDTLTPMAVRRQHGVELSRHAAFQLLKESLASDEVHVARTEADLGWAFDGRSRDGVLLVGWNGYRDEDWIRVLGSADFFLALPGVFMPFSHNVIEAMAAGCVPVLGYPGWFTPSLEDGVNCLVYRDEADLVDVVRRAAAMPAAQLARLRAGAQDYYDRYLAPAVVPKCLAELPDGASVFLQTEQSDQTVLIRNGSVGYPG